MVTTNELKEKIIAGLGLEDIEIEEIEDDMALFGDDGLGLDSVDAIELTLILEKEFGVKVKNMEESANIFSTPNTLVAYINEQRALQ
ncbi:Acyl carrier protein [hydrothermal vent metagenome]|uniref:Acyl carrier protein n=1 Tax=hydrothermal vent metagenome TaxID=652676 RepID=A0A1W1C722_9ZZZZ